MSYYPQPDTYEDQPTCPGCGYVWSTDDGGFYDENGYDLECPECELKLFCSPSVSWTFSIEHPNQCLVKGYHVPFISEEHNKHECLYCHVPLTCDCTLHDHCTHSPEFAEAAS